MSFSREPFGVLDVLDFALIKLTGLLAFRFMDEGASSLGSAQGISRTN